jgi:hypothetical protein
MIPIKDVDITIPLERYEELIEAMFGKRQENAE